MTHRARVADPLRRADRVEILEQRNRDFARDPEEILELPDVDRLTLLRAERLPRRGDHVAMQVHALREPHDRSLLHEIRDHAFDHLRFLRDGPDDLRGRRRLQPRLGVARLDHPRQLAFRAAEGLRAPGDIERVALHHGDLLIAEIGEQKIHRRAGGDQLLHELPLRHVHRHLVLLEITLQKLHRAAAESR